MAMYVYSTAGEPSAFSMRPSSTISKDDLGRIIGSRVHRLDGSYAGEWFKETVVERPDPNRAPCRPFRTRNGGSAATGTRRRAVVDYGYADAFDRLYEGGGLCEAAE